MNVEQPDEDRAAKASGRRGRPSADNIRMRMGALLGVARSQFFEHGYRKASMERIAAAAGVTKRTLYLWHRDKEALFTACMQNGAQKFPNIEMQPKRDLQQTLATYFSALLKEFTSPEAIAMGRLILREADDFPQLVAIAEQEHQAHVIEPLTRFLQQHGLEEDGECRYTLLLLAMALSPITNALVRGNAVPSGKQCREHADFTTMFFLAKFPLAPE